MGSGGPTAAARWAALDGNETDGPSIDEAFGPGGYRLPEPGQFCLDILATIQLYWPAGYRAELEEDEVVRVDGGALCPDCGLTYYTHPLAPWPIEYTGERFVHRLCDGRLGKT